MIDTTSRLRSLLALALLAASTACIGPTPLGVDTIYVVEDLDAETRERLATELRRKTSGHGLVEVPRDTEGDRFEFRLSRDADAFTVRRVTAVIESVAREAQIPVVLQSAALRFGSVQGEGRAEIVVSGRATAGATVELDVGDRTVMATVDASGRWTADIQRTPELRARAGWIYALVTKGEARQYLAMNVLDTGSSEPIAVDDLPLDSRLRDR